MSKSNLSEIEDDNIYAGSNWNLFSIVAIIGIAKIFSIVIEFGKTITETVQKINSRIKVTN